MVSSEFKDNKKGPIARSESSTRRLSTSSSDPNQLQDNEIYSLDIRYFLPIVLSLMTFFFAIGAWTVPGSPSLISITNRESTQTMKGIESSGNTNDKYNISYEFSKSLDDLNAHHVNFENPSFEDLGIGEGAIQRSTNIIKNKSSITSFPSSSLRMNQAEHLPSGQHLLVDIKNVQAAFLNSEERLAKAMVDAVNYAGLTMLSYHCHSLVPTGVSCVGVLLESHISFHTWPEEGVITLDLFTCGDNPLVPVVPELERLFGVPRTTKGREQGDEDDVEEQIVISWGHELRGFQNGNEGKYATKTRYLDNKSDLSTWAISPMDLFLKRQVISTSSEFHRIDIWDFLQKDDKPSYHDGTRHNLTEGDLRWRTPEVASPRRILFVNGALQSMDSHVREFQETLVHPAMFAHPNPVNVAVIGGADGSTIHELLKHQTVQSITMIEQDKTLIDIAREHLASMSDCSDIVDVADDCFDDKRVNVIIEDPTTWFVDRYGADPSKSSAVGRFDVIVINTVDPKHKPEMFNDELFLDSLMNALSDDGTLATYIGEAHTINDPRAELSEHAVRERFMQLLENNPNTGAMFVYEESHLAFDMNASFITVCKNVRCRDLWYSEAIVIDFEINKRIKEMKSKKPSLDHYDGSTQYLYQIPSRPWEEVYCRRDPEPFECSYRGLDLSRDLFEINVENDDESSFIVDVNRDDSGKETSAIYAKEDIPVGSYIMPSDLAASFTIREYTHNKLKSNVNIQDTGDITVIRHFLDFIDNHGHDTISDGNTLKYVEVGATFMMRKSSKMDEVNVGRWVPRHPNRKQPVYSPVYDRNMISFDVLLVATRDIKKGEELVKPMNLWK